MGVIATLLPNEVQLERVRHAVRDRHEIVACADWDQVIRVCAEGVVRLALVDLFAGGNASLDRVRELKRRSPRLTVIVYSTATTTHLHELFEAGRLGVDGLILAEEDDAPRMLLSLFERAEEWSVTSQLRESLGGVEPALVDAVLLSVSRALERLTPQSLAQLVGLPPRVLAKKLERAGFPSPHRLLTWGRLIMAAHLLEEPGRSADRVAGTVGFPSGTAFRNSCQRYLHSTPSEIRRRGGAAFVMRVMLRPMTADSQGPVTDAHRRPKLGL